MITYVDLSEELRAGTNEDIMPHAWSPAPSSQISQGYTMVESTPWP